MRTRKKKSAQNEYHIWLEGDKHQNGKKDNGGFRARAAWGGNTRKKNRVVAHL